MRIKIYYKNKAFFGGVVGKTTAGKMLVNLDGDESVAADVYRRLGEVVIMKNGKLIKDINKLAKTKTS
jgi:hypothetical protein